MKELKKELTLRNELTELEKLVPFIEQLSDELALPHELAFNLNLVLEEAISNIILYAYPGQMGKEISVQALSNGRSLILTLTDTGVPFDPTQVEDADITLSVEERPIGGLGIFLIKNIMNEVEYQRIEGKNIFTLKKEINNEE